MSNSILILISIFCWGVGSVFIKLANNNIHPLMVSSFMTLLYLILLPIGFMFFKVNPIFNTSGVIYAILGGLGMCLGSLAYFFALQTGAAGQITASISIYPAITLLLSIAFLKEEITPHKIIGCCLALIGVYLLS
jgi:uncharacterized membrane protein